MPTVKSFTYSIRSLAAPVLLLGGAAIFPLRGQLSSRHGVTLPPNGRVHALVIYAAFTDRPDPADPLWPAGKLPAYAPWLFSRNENADPAPPPVPNLTDYFRQMSGGEFILTASYFPRLFEVPSRGASGFWQTNNRVIDSVNRWLDRHPEWMPPPLCDRWTIGRPYAPKRPEPNGRWDFVIIIYRNGAALPWIGAAGGVWMDFSVPLAGRRADNCFVLTRSRVAPYPINILVHEIAHGLLGNNDYHTMGAAAGGELRRGHTAQFGMHRGWGILGGNDLFQSANAWERDRLGWHPAGARIIKLSPQQLPSGDTTIRLRDFVTRGDALRIYLPHTRNPRQYIWLEAHLKKSPFDRRWMEPAMKNCIRDRLPPAVYAYYQLGMDDTALLRPSWIDFLFPISAEGNWDYAVEDRTQMICYAGHPENVLHKVRPNPLSGYNDFRYLFFDVGPPGQPGDGEILANRHPGGKATHANNLCYQTARSTALQACEASPFPGNGGNIDVVQPYAERIGDSVYVWHSWGPEDAFTVGRAMRIDGNPTAAGVHFRGHFRRKGRRYVATPALRPIILNGLEIAVIDRSDSDFTVFVSYRHFQINRPQRWSGSPIRIEDTFEVNHRLIVDQSGTPNACFPYEETGDFSPKTRVVIHPGGGLKINRKGRLEVRRNAIVEVRPGGLLDIEKGGRVVLRGGVLRLPEGVALPRRKGIVGRLFPAVRVRRGGRIEFYSAVRP